MRVLHDVCADTRRGVRRAHGKVWSRSTVSPSTVRDAHAARDASGGSRHLSESSQRLGANIITTLQVSDYVSLFYKFRSVDRSDALHLSSPTTVLIN